MIFRALRNLLDFEKNSSTDNSKPETEIDLTIYGGDECQEKESMPAAPASPCPAPVAGDRPREAGQLLTSLDAEKRRTPVLQEQEAKREKPAPHSRFRDRHTLSEDQGAQRPSFRTAVASAVPTKISAPANPNPLKPPAALPVREEPINSTGRERTPHPVPTAPKRPKAVPALIAPLIVRKKTELSFEVWFGIQDEAGRFMALDGTLRYSFRVESLIHHSYIDHGTTTAWVKAGDFKSFSNPRGLFGVQVPLDLRESMKGPLISAIEILDFTPKGGQPIQPLIE